MDNLVAKLHKQFATKNLTLALAESCTGGLLSAELVRRPGISNIFIGSCVTYSNSSKTSLLNVSPDLIESHGAVSSEVALAMARNVRKSLESSWGLSITGIAGPNGGSKDKPVGTVWFGIAGPKFELALRQQFNGDREAIQKQAVEFALNLLLEKSG